MPPDPTPARPASIRARSFVPLLGLALLGCPSDDPTGEGSASQGSESGGADTTAAASATGTLPPATTSSSSDDAADSSGTTTLASSSGTTEDETIPTSDDGISGCDDAQCCGNGIINTGEQCDCGGMPCSPEGLGFSECAGSINPAFPDHVYTGGILDCSAASCQLVFTTCFFCGDGIINGNEACEPDPPPQATCASLGLGKATEPLPCDASCQLDTSSCA